MNIRSTRRQGFAFIDECEPLASHPQIRGQTMIWEDKNEAKAMNTLFVLMAQYNGQVVIPVERVCRDYFSHLTTSMFERKVMAGLIKIPITRMEANQNSAKAQASDFT